MCGIAGFFDLTLAASDAAAVLTRMREAIRHRGPDDHGQLTDGPVGLATQRLSIVDPVGGAQPMTSADGTVSLVFNGEIYNHPALRAAHEAAGRRFRTRSDTEVLLAQYERYGLDGLDGLNGMFAAAIWDRRSARLHLVRDRMGVKPLYYFVDGKRLYFASEIKSLIAAKRFSPAVNPRAIWDFLTFRYVPAPETIWEGVFKLPPAHTLTVSGSDFAPVPRRWWDMPYARPRDRATLARPEDFPALFEDAVNIRMVADVPVGLFLSGGLDSSAVAAAVDRHRFPDLRTYAVSLDAGGEDDELAFAGMVSQALNTQHHEVVLTGADFAGEIEAMPWHLDEPMADATAVPLHALARRAREDVKVVLSGEGSDEILAGYTFDAVQMQWDAMLPHERPPGGMLGPLWRLVAGRGGRRSHPADQRRAAVPLHIVDYFGSEEKTMLFRAGQAFRDSHDVLRRDVAPVTDPEPLHQSLYLYCQNWLVEDLLMKADKTTMAASLELRTPFLDVRLVEHAARLPRSAKLARRAGSGYVTKAVLRDYARRRLPPTIVDRPKKGFPVPVYRWLSGPLKALAGDRLASPSARCLDWLEAGAVRALLRDGTAADASMAARHRLWNLLVLELWLARWTT